MSVFCALVHGKFLALPQIPAELSLADFDRNPEFPGR
jgi:hypothetical protein